MPLIRKPPDEIAKAAKPVVDVTSGLADAAPDARWAAARAAADQPEAAPVLAQALAHESDGRVREAIFTALARIATPESVLAVLPYIQSDNSGLRTGALDALRSMPTATEPYLAQLLADPDSDVRLLACDLARVMPGPQIPQLLCGLLQNDVEANVCAAAVEVLAEIGTPDAIPALERCAARFPNDPFLSFAIEAASSRLASHADRG